MNTQTYNNNSRQVALKTLWGASAMPFEAAAKKTFKWDHFNQIHQRLQQLVSLKSSGVLTGAHGVGKSYLIHQFIESLNAKLYKSIVLCHSSLSGNGLIRALCKSLQLPPRLTQAHNIAGLHQCWKDILPQWPILILEEAQNLTPSALEEIRLLTCQNLDTAPAFSLIIVGDDHLMPRLMMGINTALFSRLSFCMRLSSFDQTLVSQYIQTRLSEVALNNDPFDPQAIHLIAQASKGAARTINHLAQAAMEKAASQNAQIITCEHIQWAIDQMPWLTVIHE